MDSLFSYKLLFTTINTLGYANIKVNGNSMQPTINNNDIITIKKQENYYIGDILVFLYKDAELLAHRLLKIDKNYYCKGDNSFRLEDIKEDQILGKVVQINKTDISPWYDWQILFSYTINKIFHQYRYDVKLTKQTNEYKLYNAIILNKDIFFKTTNDCFDHRPPSQQALFYLNSNYNAALPLEPTEKKIISILTNNSSIVELISKFDFFENSSSVMYNVIGKALFNLVINGIINVCYNC